MSATQINANQRLEAAPIDSVKNSVHRLELFVKDLQKALNSKTVNMDFVYNNLVNIQNVAKSAAEDAKDLDKG